MEVKKTAKNCILPASLFYELFQLGLEIEGEFNFGSTELISELSGQWEVKNDGSLRSTGNGNCYEIVSDVLKDKEQEEAAIEKLKDIEFDHEGKKLIAFRNTSAGTHIHFSLKGSNVEENRLNKKRLFIFDTIDFEKYFFKRYFSRFKTSKFESRVGGDYCRSFAVISKNGPTNRMDTVEQRKNGGRDRYFWLNVDSIYQGKGLEIRIFPHIQTVSGIKEVIEFTKETIINYYAKSSTKERLKWLDKFNEIEEAKINFNALSELENMIVKLLYIPEHLADAYSSSHRVSTLSGDSKILLAKWYKKKPKLVNFSGDDVI